jgi:hypothetical protein
MFDHRLGRCWTFGHCLQSRGQMYTGNQRPASARRSSGLRIRGAAYAAYEFPKGRCKRRPAETVGWQGSTFHVPRNEFPTKLTVLRKCSPSGSSRGTGRGTYESWGGRASAVTVTCLAAFLKFQKRRHESACCQGVTKQAARLQNATAQVWVAARKASCSA